MQKQERILDLSSLGYISLAVACLTFGALYLNKITVEAFPIMACWLIAGAVLLFAIAKGNGTEDGYVRVLFFLFAAFLFLAPALGMGLKYALMKAGLPYDSRVEGFGWLAAAAFLTLSLPLTLRCHALLGLMLLLLTVVLWLLFVANYYLATRETLAAAIGWLFMITGVLGIYIGSATVVNQVGGRIILPLPGAMIKS
jgi:succinate-acetate transporter protein